MADAEKTMKQYRDYAGGPIWRDDKQAYYVEIRWPDGTRSQWQSKNKRKLERRWLKAMSDIESGRWDKKAPRHVTFGVATDDYLKWSKAHHDSHKSYVCWAFKGWKAEFGSDELICRITAARLNQYQLSRVDLDAPSTVNKRFAVLKAAFNFWINQGLCSDNPVEKVKFLPEDNEIVRFLTPDEYDELRAAAQKVRGWYLPHLFDVAVNTGLRRGNLLKLRWDECAFDASVIRIQKTKNKRPHAVPMNAAVRRALREAEKQTGEFEYVFAHTAGKKKGEPLGDITKAWKACVESAGFTDPLRFHDLRHTFASWLVMSGVSIYTVQRLLGHRSIQSTMRYAHLAPDFAQQAVNVLDGIGGTTNFSPLSASNAGQDKQDVTTPDETEREKSAMPIED